MFRLDTATTRGILCGWLLSVTAVALAGEESARQFERAWYLETHEGNPEAAAAAYQEVSANADAPEALRAEAAARVARLREDLAASDLARIMPAGALAYLEIRQPGVHVARLARQLGLDADASAAAAAKGNGIPLGDGFFLPHEPAISPALLAALTEFRGVAAAMTSFDERTGPQGVLAVHPGESDLVRGVLETAIQMLEPAEAIGGFRTYRLQNEVWIVQTARLFIASRSREDAAAAVARLGDRQAESLAGVADFQRHADQRSDALLFGYVNGPGLVQRLGAELRHSEEARIARAVLDLDRLQTLTVTLGTTEAGVHAQLRLDLAEGHRNLAYALVRTGPLSRRTIDCIPAGTAALALLGLSPAGEPVAGDADARGPLSVMGIGRELFANVEELAVFVLPSAGGAGAGRLPVPDLGLIIAAKDPARSESLWNQLLALPALLFAAQVQPPAEIEIHGRTAREYRFPEVPPIVLVRLDEHGIALGTQSAVAAALRACSGENRLADDPAFRPLIERLPPAAAKAVLIDVARVLDVAARLPDGDDLHGMDAEELEWLTSLVAPLRIVVATDEAPNSVTVRLDAGGLPDVPKILRTVAEMEQFRHRSRAEVPPGRRSAPVATIDAGVDVDRSGREPAGAVRQPEMGRDR